MADDAAHDSFTLRLDAVIRSCREDDLPALEWFGLFAPHRALIRSVFAQHRRGEALMLVAEVNGHASGQLWIDFARRAQGAAEIWAVRVLPCLQGSGIGARLLAAAEAWLREQGITRAELAVETDNPRARAFYERLGYRMAGTVVAGDPPALPHPQERMQWLLCKQLETSVPADTASASAGPSGTSATRGSRPCGCPSAVHSTSSAPVPAMPFA